MLRSHQIAAGFTACLACTVFANAREEGTKYEMPKYSVTKRDGQAEIRQYEPYIVAYTEVAGDPKAAGNEGFRRLFRDISGANRSRQSIAMTAPVTQVPGAAEGAADSSEQIAMTAPVGQKRVGNLWRIEFMMPSEYTMKALPEPLDSRVKLERIPARAVAATRYSGTWAWNRYEKHLSRLREWVEASELRTVGEPIWARYDSPFKPWFLRRNEIQVQLKTPDYHDERPERKTVTPVEEGTLQ